MGGFPAPGQEDRTRPLMMLGGVLLLMGALLFVGRSEGESAPGSGNCQPAPMGPGAPISGPAGDSPINDAPSVTIIEDIRDTMRRLPDRQTPRGWGGRPKPKPG